MFYVLAQTANDPVTSSFIGELLSTYGVEGGILGVMIWMFTNQTKKSEKRISDLEKQMSEQNQEYIEAHKAMINDYVELVKNKTRVLADLTNCINAIKHTLDRIERDKTK